jgi:hypothetical protein
MKAGVTAEEWKGFIAYAAGFYSNMTKSDLELIKQFMKD